MKRPLSIYLISTEHCSFGSLDQNIFLCSIHNFPLVVALLIHCVVTSRVEAFYLFVSISSISSCFSHAGSVLNFSLLVILSSSGATRQAKTSWPTFLSSRVWWVSSLIIRDGVIWRIRIWPHPDTFFFDGLGIGYVKPEPLTILVSVKNVPLHHWTMVRKK